VTYNIVLKFNYCHVKLFFRYSEKKPRKLHGSKTLYSFIELISLLCFNRIKHLLLFVHFFLLAFLIDFIFIKVCLRFP
jgi:hypothetical protein